MLRIGLIITLAALLLFLLGQMWYFYEQGKASEQAFTELRAEFDRTRAENDSLKADLEYYQHPENLEKELRARFNYRLEGEKMIIIVPPHIASSTTSTTP